MTDQFFDREQADLWKLIAERAAPGANLDEIDAQIWETYGEDAAIMFTDLAGFTRRSAELGITHFLQIIFESQHVLRPLVDEHSGIIFEVVGDSMLLWFPTVQNAIECSVAMHEACRQHNACRETSHQVLLCVGIGCGRILRVGNSRLAGKEVNVASKLGEDIAEAYETLISDSARKAAGEMAGLEFIVTGEQQPGSPEVYRVTTT